MISFSMHMNRYTKCLPEYIPKLIWRC